MKKLLVVVPMMFGLMLSGHAETIVHYHFNDFPLGYEVQATDRYLNAANPETYAAIPRKPKNGDSLIKKFPDRYPFLQNMAVYDPVSKEIYRNLGAVHIQRGQYHGSYLEIPSDANLLSGPEFTVEFFYCPVSVPHREYGNYLYAKDGLMNAYCPAADTSFHWLTFYYLDGEGANKSVRYETNIHNAIGSNSNMWNHIAMTVDTVKGEYKMFFNYLQVGTTKTFTGSLRDHAANPFFIGSTSNNNNADIAVAEFRISDRALTTSQFLRLCSPNTLPETTHYFDFDSSTNLVWNTNVYRNNAPSPSESNGTLTNPSNLCGLETDSVVGKTIRKGLLALDSEQTSNAKTLAFKAASDSLDQSGRFTMTGGTKLWTTDFTLEFDFKSPSWRKGVSDSAWLFFCGNNYARVWNSQRVSIKLPGVTDGSVYLEGLMDDNWHHLAYVFDKKALRHAFYVDGVVKHAWSSTTAPSAPSDNTIYFGQAPNWGEGYALQNARFDNIRITQKALRPSEFLTEKAYEGETLAWYSYEKGLDNGVYTNSVKGAVLAGSAAVLPRPPRKDLLDKDGNVMRENTKSLSLTSGKATYARNSLLERSDLTVELFAKETASSPNGGLVTICRSEDGTVAGASDPADVMWALRVGADGRTPELYVANETEQTVAFPRGSELAGTWRHYAVAFVEDGNDTTVKLYVDWNLVKTATLAGKIRLPSAVGGAIPLLGATSSTDAGSFAGLVDEVRITRGEIGLDDFLRLPPAPGLLLIIR